MFETLLPLAVKYQGPVGIHSRGGGQWGVWVYLPGDSEQNITPGAPIHLHCFCADIKEVEAWLEAFPANVFGIAASIACAVERTKVLRQIPLQKLVLKTDSPYLLPAKFKSRARYSNPGMILQAARVIATAKKMPLSTVCKVTRA